MFGHMFIHESENSKQSTLNGISNGPPVWSLVLQKIWFENKALYERVS